MIVGLGDNPGLLAVSPPVSDPGVGLHYIQRLASHLKNTNAHWPAPNYTAWRQKHTTVSSFAQGQYAVVPSHDVSDGERLSLFNKRV